MNILVTGAGGLLGGAVVRAARERGHTVDALDRADLDVTDAEAVHRWITERKPEAVIHCAAYTAVDRAEEEAELAMQVNRDGTANVALASADVGAAVFLPSTDYVFDGESSRPYQPGDKPRPYRPDDQPRPLNAYGRSKLAGEQALRAAGGTWVIVRTSWLYGADGRDFVDVILASGDRTEPMAIVDDQVGCPTWTGSLAPALVELVEQGATGTLHLCDRGEATWLDLAREVASFGGIEVELTATTTEAWGAPAARPRYSVLDSSEAEALLDRTMPTWGESLRAHLGR